MTLELYYSSNVWPILIDHIVLKLANGRRATLTFEDSERTMERDGSGHRYDICEKHEKAFLSGKLLTNFDKLIGARIDKIEVETERMYENMNISIKQILLTQGGNLFNIPSSTEGASACAVRKNDVAERFWKEKK